jgi:hypothetical protein
MTGGLAERIWETERGALAQDEAFAAAKRTALARLDDEEQEVVGQVLASVGDMETPRELESVLEVLDASFGDIPRLVLAKYAALLEEEGP